MFGFVFAHGKFLRNTRAQLAIAAVAAGPSCVSGVTSVVGTAG